MHLLKSRASAPKHGQHDPGLVFLCHQLAGSMSALTNCSGEPSSERRYVLVVLSELVAGLKADRTIEGDSRNVIGVVAHDGCLHARCAHPPHPLVHQGTSEAAALEVTMTADRLE